MKGKTKVDVLEYIIIDRVRRAVCNDKFLDWVKERDTRSIVTTCFDPKGKYWVHLWKAGHNLCCTPFSHLELADGNCIQANHLCDVASQ